MKHNRITIAAAAGAAALALTASTLVASAHTPSGGASCSGIWGRMANAPADFETTITLEVDGQVVKSASNTGNWTLSADVPQDYDRHRWAVVVDGAGTKYDGSDSGSFGPCKEKPTETPKPTPTHTPSPTPTEPEETPSATPSEPTTTPSQPASPTSPPTPTTSTPTPEPTTPTAPPATPTPSQPTTSTPSAPPSSTPSKPGETPEPPTSPPTSEPQKPAKPVTPNIGTPEHQEIPDCKATEYWQNNRGCTPLAPPNTVQEGF